MLIGHTRPWRAELSSAGSLIVHWLPELLTGRWYPSIASYLAVSINGRWREHPWRVGRPCAILPNPPCLIRHPIPVPAMIRDVAPVSRQLPAATTYLVVIGIRAGFCGTRDVRRNDLRPLPGIHSPGRSAGCCREDNDNNCAQSDSSAHGWAPSQIHRQRIGWRRRPAKQTQHTVCHPYFALPNPQALITAAAYSR
jgi:hypothetical protein